MIFLAIHSGTRNSWFIYWSLLVSVSQVTQMNFKMSFPGFLLLFLATTASTSYIPRMSLRYQSGWTTASPANIHWQELKNYQVNALTWSATRKHIIEGSVAFFWIFSIHVQLHQFHWIFQTLCRRGSLIAREGDCDVRTNTLEEFTLFLSIRRQRPSAKALLMWISSSENIRTEEACARPRKVSWKSKGWGVRQV
jgi:hypothetical protein